MVHDLLPVDGARYEYQAEDQTGKRVKKEAILDEEKDSLWREFRHMHIADVMPQLEDRFGNFRNSNAAAKHAGGDSMSMPDCGCLCICDCYTSILSKTVMKSYRIRMIYHALLHVSDVI